MPRKKSLTESQEKDVIQKYKNGMKTTDAATLFGVSLTTIQSILRENGIKFRRATWSKERREVYSKAAQDRFAKGIKPTMKGRKHSEQTINKMKVAQLGSKSPRWNKGRMKVKARNGRGHYVYILSPDHPSVVDKVKRYVAEHRLVMEKHIGRYLTSNENVHHLNGIKDDNRIENLEIVTHNNHFGEVVCPHCQNCFKIK